VASVITANLGPDGFPLEAGYIHGFALLVATSALATLVAVFVPVVKARTHIVPGPQAEYEALHPMTPEEASFEPERSRARG
jgi:hypothetical protein